MTATLFDASVTEAADQVAAIDHIPTEYAHDIVSATAPVACATNLRRLAALAHDTIITPDGTYRAVRVDDLIATARILEEQSAHSIQALVADAATREGHEALELDRLRAENAALRAGHEAVVDELVRRHLMRCDYIGEHPPTVEQRAQIEADVRTAWAAIALAGGAR
jgi:hypothetical protein